MIYSTIFELAKNDFKSRYKGSILGVLWAFCQPAITVLVYWFVFQIAFKNNSVDGVPYVLWLVLGLVPWLFFSETWSGINSVLNDYSFLVKKLVFNIKILPLIRLYSALFTHLFFVAIVFVIAICYKTSMNLIHLQILYYILASAIFVLGLGTITCVLTVFFKDFSNLVGILIQFGFWLTPVFWDISAIPSQLIWIFKLNPMYYIIQGFRDTFLHHKLFFEEGYLSLYFWAVSLSMLFLGHYFFKRSRPHFADLI